MYKTSNLRRHHRHYCTLEITILIVSSESYIVSKLILLDFSVNYEKHFEFVFDATEKISIIWQYNVTCFS